MIYNTITSNAATADNDESSARATPTQRWPGPEARRWPGGPEARCCHSQATATGTNSVMCTTERSCCAYLGVLMQLLHLQHLRFDHAHSLQARRASRRHVVITAHVAAHQLAQALLLVLDLLAAA